MKSPALYKSKVFLHDRYVLKKMTIRQIAAETGASVGIIQKYLKDFGLINNPRQSRGRK